MSTSNPKNAFIGAVKKDLGIEDVDVTFEVIYQGTYINGICVTSKYPELQSDGSYLIYDTYTYRDSVSKDWAIRIGAQLKALQKIIGGKKVSETYYYNTCEKYARQFYKSYAYSPKDSGITYEEYLKIKSEQLN